jgi:hypothetical protein
MIERNKPGHAAAGRRHGLQGMALSRPSAPSEHPSPAAEGDEVTTPDGVQDLIAWARAERAHSALFSFERAYYFGIETAAEQVLHPEGEALRSVGWLDRYNPAFVSGYTEAVAMLAPLWSWGSVQRSARAHQR